MMLPGVGMANPVIVPVGVMRPILSEPNEDVSVNQRLPSGPAIIPLRELPCVGVANPVTVPVGVMRSILDTFLSVNQRLPSDPNAIACPTMLPGGGMANSVIVPVGVMRPILSDSTPRPEGVISVNQRLPSGPVIRFPIPSP